MNYIIFDLEATCWEGDYDRPETDPSTETIEIGAVKLNDKLEIVDTFQTFIKPVLNPTLSEFCNKLTTITQDDVDKAPEFNRALMNFQHWIQTNKDGKNEPYYLCSWGFYDRKQLTADCERNMKDIAWLEKHISIKHQHGDMLAEDWLQRIQESGEEVLAKYLKDRSDRMRRGVGMHKAMNILGIEPTGTHHRGIDDAKNIALIFTRIFNRLKFPQ